MDLSNFTIPPDLFYSKKPDELWKPNRIKEVSPKQITKSIKKIKKVLIRRKPLKLKTPVLGRIGKFMRYVKKKKPLGVLKEKSGNILPSNDNKQLKNNNNNLVKSIGHLTQQEERAMLNDIREKEEAIKKRMFTSEIVAKKRFKGSSFKFFKSKNDRDEEEETQSDESEDLVSEIRDFSEKEDSPNNSIVVVAEIHKEPAGKILDTTPFEDDKDESDIEETTTAIESLLKNLDYNKDLENIETSAEPQKEGSLDDLINTLESGVNECQEVDNKSDKKEVKHKQKFLGLGENQLQIDAGQKKFGLVECKDCGFSYNVSGV